MGSSRGMTTCAIEDADELHDELVRTVRGLHNLNLQRCDRRTMAHSLEARVPFLDREVFRWALRLPAGYKLAAAGQPEKRLLRMAFEGWLPDELLWREKRSSATGAEPATFSPRSLPGASRTRISRRSVTR